VMALHGLPPRSIATPAGNAPELRVHTPLHPILVHEQCACLPSQPLQ
jgi:hypothetical protein